MNNSTSNIKWGRFIALIVLMLLAVGLMVGAFIAFITATDDATLEPIDSNNHVELEQPAEMPATGVDAARALEPIEHGAPDVAASSATPPVADAPAEPAAPASSWAEAMNTAGIAPADQPIVERLSTRANIILPSGCSCVRMVRPSTDPSTYVTSFQILNSYVLNRHGSWSAAQAFADANGGSW